MDTSLNNSKENHSIKKSLDFYNLMKTRRSVRQFSEKNVADEILLNAVKTAGSSPSGANRQPWHFAIIKSQDIKNKIRTAAESVEHNFYNNQSAKQWIEDLKPFGTNEHKPYLSKAPALIAIFSRTQITEADQNIQKTYYPIESTGIAVGFLITALHQAGLSTLTHTPRPMCFLNEVLNLDKTYKPFMIVVAGYPELPIVLPNITRKDITEISAIY
jgi:iodotyrosine deiodinase